MNRSELRQLAEDRILDAERLLTGGRWSGAYYLAGYAVECGLKACILAYVEAKGAIFEDKKFSEKCWTHDLEALLILANLGSAMDIADPKIVNNWETVIEWNEISRYEKKTQAEAQAMYNAIAGNSDGVLPWLRQHW